MRAGQAANPKLTRRLKRALILTLIAVLVLATLAAAITAYMQASDIQDETLLSVAQLVESNQMQAATDDDVFDDDDFDDSAVRVWELGKRSRHNIEINKSIKSGFHTVHKRNDFWRIYVTNKNRTGKQFIIAQKASVSAELALKSAQNTAFPLLLLVLAIPLLVTLVVRHSFKPLNALATKVENSTSLKLELEDKLVIPAELTPFISAIDDLLDKNELNNQQQRRFIADAAHELRTPITALSLQIDNVRSAETDEIKQERQAALTKSVSRLQRLVNQLLDLARAQSGLSRNESIVSLNDQVKTQIAELYPLAEQKNIQLSVVRNDEVHVVDNNNQLQHLLRNALSNAIKFAPDNGIVDIAVFGEGEQAWFDVSDNGPGVPEEHLQKLRVPFYRPDGQTSGNGAGLGLAICHEIATQLNGRIRLENVDPNGFKFSYSVARANPTIDS